MVLLVIGRGEIDRGLRAFTIKELLAILATIGLLAATLAPALAKTQSKSHLAQCMSNGHQMVRAWQMYVSDNEEGLPKASGSNQWCDGWLDYSPGNRSNWDVNQDLARSQLWRYCGENAALWRCPADPSTVKVRGVELPRVRSISMNYWLGSDGSALGTYGLGFKLFKRSDDLANPGPSQIYVLLDEKPESINDAVLLVNMTGYPNRGEAWRIVDYPAGFHGNAGSFFFADGHFELRKWQDRRTYPLVRGVLPLNVASPNNRDLYWLMEHATRKEDE